MSIFSPSTCLHIDPKLFAEKLPKQNNLSIHQVISILNLPPVVSDHITTLLTKHAFQLKHLPYLTLADLIIILQPPFPTPPLVCAHNVIEILSHSLDSLKFSPTFPQSTPASTRPQVIACIESLELAAKTPVSTVQAIHQRIQLQINLRNILLSITQPQLDVNVTIPNHKNIKTEFDIERVIDDLQHCYALYIQEQEQKAKLEEHGNALADLGIEIPNSTSNNHTSSSSNTVAIAPQSNISPPQQKQLTPTNALTTKDTNNNTNNNSSLFKRAQLSSTTGSSTTNSTTQTRPASSSLRPSKYHTLNLRKETHVSLTKLDAYGNHTPIYGDDSTAENSAEVSQALSSPQSNQHLAIFSAPITPVGTNNNNIIKNQSTTTTTTTTTTTLNRIHSSHHSSTSVSSSRSSLDTPIQPLLLTESQGIKTNTTQHPQPSPLVGPNTNGLQKVAEQSLQQSSPPFININTSSTQSVDSFNSYTPRARSGTNPNLSQLADRFAIGNTDLWVPYWKKNSTQLEELLTSWDFSLFNDIEEKHRSEILLRLTVFMFVNCGVVQAFNIPLDKLTRFLNHVSTLYRDNPYHNYLHAWTTLHYTYLLIKHTSANRRIEYSNVVTLAMLLASICHDVDHPGNNNHFEVQTMSKLALLHNDNSVLENHHCFVTFSLLSRPEFSILSTLTKQQLKEARSLIVSIILNTDMALHNDLTDAFGKASEELLAAAPTDPSNTTAQTLAVNTSASYALIARVLVHCSDLAGQALPLKSAYLWAMRLREEFTNQADTEARLNLPVTPFMSGLDDITFARSQLGFIRGVLRPLWVRMSITFPATKPSLQHISANELFWQSFIEIYENAAGDNARQRTFSMTSTLATPVRSTNNGAQAGRKYTLEQHYIRQLQARDLQNVPETPDLE